MMLSPGVRAAEAVVNLVLFVQIPRLVGRGIQAQGAVSEEEQRRP
jgi:hypothetical protein